MRKFVIISETTADLAKAGAIAHEFKEKGKCDIVLVHIGSYENEQLLKLYIKESELPMPDAFITIEELKEMDYFSRVLQGFAQICEKEIPEIVFVVGDHNGALACAIVASKMHFAIARIEAGLRNINRSSENINRILIDHISNHFFTSSDDANHNLKKEGIPEHKIFCVGNVLLDSIVKHIKHTKSLKIQEKLKLKQNNESKSYALLKLEKEDTISNDKLLSGIFSMAEKLSQKLPVVFMTESALMGKKYKQFIRFINHPELITPPDQETTEENIANFHHAFPDHATEVQEIIPCKILLIKHPSYVQSLSLIANAAIVLTDSGELQEETTFLGIPCLTLGESTDRPITSREGTNQIVGTNPIQIANTAFDVLNYAPTHRLVPKYWDGHAASRIMEIIETLQKENML